MAAANPQDWFLEHTMSERACLCNMGAPDRKCDVGEALIRVSIKHGAAHVLPNTKPV